MSSSECPSCMGTALVLGSLWALAIGGIITLLFIVRTALEDRTLDGSLPVTKNTRHRRAIGCCQGSGEVALRRAVLIR